jgi:hypothetical protein
MIVHFKEVIPMSLNRDRGKRLERTTAAVLGGRRLGVMGGQDVEAGLFSVECKSRQKFVAQSWMDQAKRNCPPERVPMVVVHVHGQRHADDLVMVRMSDWRDLYGEPGGRP